MNTPFDILNYILNNHMESDFMISVAQHVGNFSIGEIPDKVFEVQDGRLMFSSKAYQVHVEIKDEDVITAVHNQLYVSAFKSRKDNEFQLHFLVHQYPAGMKYRFEEEICKEVVQYMILNTIIALRLDTFEKVKKYIDSKQG